MAGLGNFVFRKLLEDIGFNLDAVHREYMFPIAREPHSATLCCAGRIRGLGALEGLRAADFTCATCIFCALLLPD